jgi:hypothetical protein
MIPDDRWLRFSTGYNPPMSSPTPPELAPENDASLLPDLEMTPKPVVALDSDRVYRVGGTRVRLETVIAAFSQGYTAEEIMLKYPSLKLADVYSTIAYYLEHRDAVDAYLESRRRQTEQARQELEVRFPSAGVRDRLLARWKSHP